MSRSSSTKSGFNSCEQEEQILCNQTARRNIFRCNFQTARKLFLLLALSLSLHGRTTSMSIKHKAAQTRPPLATTKTAPSTPLKQPTQSRTAFAGDVMFLFSRLRISLWPCGEGENGNNKENIYCLLNLINIRPRGVMRAVRRVVSTRAQCSVLRQFQWEKSWRGWRSQLRSAVCGQ